MKDFKEFSTEEIQDIAKQSAEKARMEALKDGLEVASQDLETGEMYLERLTESGAIERRKMPDDYIQQINTEKKP